MSRWLSIWVRLHDGRYHGAGEWPPSPARLFQALVAGAGLSGPLSKNDSEVLEWLENQEPPLIGAPLARDGQSVTFYMPNNDLDAVGGDPRRIVKIRGARKIVKPRLLDAKVPFLYAWPLGEDEETQRHAAAICTLVERLYQFGRGVDFAWAWGEVLDDETLKALLLAYPGCLYRPSIRGGGQPLACPQQGSLESLKARHLAYSRRFAAEGEGKKARRIFSQPPRPRFAQVPYDSPPSRRVYELRERTSEASFFTWPLARASTLVVLLRDAVVRRLKQGLLVQSADIDRVLIGRKPDGTNDGPLSARVRVIPLPSIGHPQADRLIRRVLVEVPAECPLRADDVHWAFSGLELSDLKGGEVLEMVLTPAAEESARKMLAHYGIGEKAWGRIWRTVTPAALPETAGFYRIDLACKTMEAKGGQQRLQKHTRAAIAVMQSLRHAGIRPRVNAIRVQREPFEASGERAEAFAAGTRFPKERLWHVEIAFDTPVAGPLVIGDGRFLGLGVMVPARDARRISS